jgi:hypothetical protein
VLDMLGFFILTGYTAVCPGPSMLQLRNLRPTLS